MIRQMKIALFCKMGFTYTRLLVKTNVMSNQNSYFKKTIDIKIKLVLILKSQEDIEAEIFWDKLEIFCLNLDAKIAYFVEKNHEQHEKSEKFSMYLSNQTHKMDFAN